MNTYKSSDGTWFVLVATPDKVPAVLKAMGREDILTDPRFSDPAKLAQNRPQLTAILDEIFGSQPMSHWYEVFNGVHVPFGAVHGPQEVINDPQLRANDIVVPLEGAGEKLTSTISSPIQVHGVSKVPAGRAPGIGEHNDEVLKELGFASDDIEALRASGAVPRFKRNRSQRTEKVRNKRLLTWNSLHVESTSRSTMSDIVTERSGSILRIQFNRPAKKNAMTSAMYISHGGYFQRCSKR